MAEHRRLAPAGTVTGPVWFESHPFRFHRYHTMNRRRFLASVASGASAALAGCPSDPPRVPDPEGPGGGNRSGEGRDGPSVVDVPYADRYGSVVNLATAGANPRADEPIDDLLREVVDDDTLVFFPPGRYRFDGEWQLPSFEHVGMVGRNATIVPRRGHAGYLFTVGRPGDASGFRFEGFTFDYRARGTGPRAIQARVDDGLVVRDVTVRGRQDTDQGVTRFDVTAKDGVGEVTRLRIPDGGKPTTVATGCLVGPASTGDITFTDCHISGFPDNGLYASPATGKVTVRGGTYANSGVANVRVSAPSLVEGVTVRCDRSVPGITNMRGIRIRGGAGAVVRDSTVEFRTVNYSDGAIVLSAETGPARIENCTVRIDTDGVAALRAKNPARYGGQAAPGVECRGLRVTGSAARAAAIRLVDRPGSTIDGVCIRQTGPSRNGVLLLRSGNTRVAGDISVTGRPLVVDGSKKVLRSISPVRGGC